MDERVKSLPPFSRNKILVTVALAFAISLAATKAALVLYEGFDYPSATSFTGSTGGTGWSGAWTLAGGTGGVVGTPGFGYTDAGGDILTTSGNYGSANSSGAGTLSLTRTFAAITSGTVWMSFLANGSTGNFSVGVQLFNGSGGNGVVIGKNSNATNKTDWGIRPLGNGAISSDFVDSGVAMPGTSGTPTLVVLAVTLSGSGLTNHNDVVQVFLNPSLNSTPTTPDATFSTATIGSLSKIGANSASGSTFNLDEFRLGSSFADVTPYTVPEPKAAALLGLGLVGALLTKGAFRRWFPGAFGVAFAR